jgi:hypothetical protein
MCVYVCVCVCVYEKKYEICCLDTKTTNLRNLHPFFLFSFLGFAPFFLSCSSPEASTLLREGLVVNLDPFQNAFE